MATTTASVSDTIKQLAQARSMCLADPKNLYTQIIPGLAPVIHAGAALELRRWGTEFLSEAFSSPMLAASQKQELAIGILDNLKGYLDNADEDAMVVKSVIQIASTIYQFVVRHIISHPKDAETWQKMAVIKSAILRRMDSAQAGIHLGCIKFLQRIIQAQTPGMIADPRRPEQNEISLALVPRDHPIIPYSNLEAEASGLLDRLLNVFEENSGDALIVTATLNSLATLVRTRASIANKIVSTVLAFNPFALAQAHSPYTTKTKLMVRSITRTVIAFLFNITKKHPQHPLAARVHPVAERLRQSLIDVFDETKRKRPAFDEPTDGLSDAKRQRLGAETDLPSQEAPFPPNAGPVTFAQLFTLEKDATLSGIDVTQIPPEMAAQVVFGLLTSISATQLDHSLNVVRTRFLKLSQMRTNDATMAARAAVGDAMEDDDDYEPDMPAANTEQILNELDQAGEPLPELSFGPYHLPPPPVLTTETAASLGQAAVMKVFNKLNGLDQQVVTKTVPKGLHQLVATNHDRNAWITILLRLATRSASGLTIDSDDSKDLARRPFSAADAVRDALYIYIIEDFRRRIDIGIAWLNEEWYNEKLGPATLDTHRPSTNGNEQGSSITSQYNKWLYKMLDGFLPFLDAKDRLLIRFLSEIPEMGPEVVSRVVRLAADPDRVNLAVQALYYLVLYRPPVKEICLDGLEDLWRNYEDAKAPAQKLLIKYRPAVVESAGNVETKVKTEA